MILKKLPFQKSCNFALKTEKSLFNIKKEIRICEIRCILFAFMLIKFMLHTESFLYRSLKTTWNPAMLLPLKCMYMRMALMENKIKSFYAANRFIGISKADKIPEFCGNHNACIWASHIKNAGFRNLVVKESEKHMNFDNSEVTKTHVCALPSHQNKKLTEYNKLVV